MRDNKQPSGESSAEGSRILGDVYMSWSKYKEAIESYKQAIKINPDYAEAHYRIAAAYLQTDNKSCAITHYEILKKLDAKLAKELSKYFDLFNDIHKNR